MPRIPTARYEKIIALAATGLTWAEIGKRLGIPKRTLIDIRKTEGFKAVAKSVQSDLLHGAADIMKAGAVEASKFLIELVQDERMEVRDRAAAARFLADTSLRFLEKLELEEKDAEAGMKPDFYYEEKE